MMKLIIGILVSMLIAMAAAQAFLLLKPATTTSRAQPCTISGAVKILGAVKCL